MRSKPVDAGFHPIRERSVDLPQEAVGRANAKCSLSIVGGIVVDVHALRCFEHGIQVRERPAKTGDNFLNGNGMPALHDATGDAARVDDRVFGADEEDPDEIASGAGAPDEIHLVRNGEDRLEGQACALCKKLLASLLCPPCGLHDGLR